LFFKIGELYLVCARVRYKPPNPVLKWEDIEQDV
jgi:hypothetical protein